jgi:hypothetical protein
MVKWSILVDFSSLEKDQIVDSASWFLERLLSRSGRIRPVGREIA